VPTARSHSAIRDESLQKLSDYYESSRAFLGDPMGDHDVLVTLDTSADSSMPMRSCTDDAIGVSISPKHCNVTGLLRSAKSLSNKPITFLRRHRRLDFGLSQ
jgi:hypothetical protein